MVNQNNIQSRAFTPKLWYIFQTNKKSGNKLRRLGVKIFENMLNDRTLSQNACADRWDNIINQKAS